MMVEVRKWRVRGDDGIVKFCTLQPPPQILIPIFARGLVLKFQIGQSYLLLTRWGSKLAALFL